MDAPARLVGDPDVGAPTARQVTVAMCGDVMLGRGVDQALAHPGDPALHEAWLTDARDYVTLAERVNGPVPRPVEDAWPWGEALDVLDESAAHVRVINLETSVTVSDDVTRGKAVHYRMHPRNVGAVTVARPDVCVLANNHVLDWGRRGLSETLAALHRAGVRTAGAGPDRDTAFTPAIVPLAGDGRLLVLAVGMGSSGIPPDWEARSDRSGVAFLHDATPEGAQRILDVVAGHRRDGDLVLVSVHWGSNWGYTVPQRHVEFAHQLVEGGVDMLHGHSSHHPRPVMVHDGRLVLYGCGDLVNDYEGIGGHEAYRPELRLLYLATIEHPTGRLLTLRMVPLRARRLRLERASVEEAAWLADQLDRASRPFGSAIGLAPDGSLALVRP